MAAPALEVRSLSRMFKALGDENRIRVIALLSHGELCVCHLEDALDMAQPTVSRHLSVLRAAGVVDSRRSGNWIYYRLAPQSDAGCQRQLKVLARSFAKQELLRRDVEKLLRVKGPDSCK